MTDQSSRPFAGEDPCAGEDNLERLIEQLEEAEINCWVGTAPPSHIAAGIHDPSGGPDVRTVFEPVDGHWPHDAITHWLRTTAERLYPGRLG